MIIFIDLFKRVQARVKDCLCASATVLVFLSSRSSVEKQNHRHFVLLQVVTLANVNSIMA